MRETAVPTLSILLPVHNEAESIEATLREIYEEIAPRVPLTFIVCEDGSKDETRDILRRLTTELPIRLNLSEQRKGYSRAVREGFEMTATPYLLCLDSDGQCDPKDFWEFWKQRDAFDVLAGWRTERADPAVRRTFSRIFYLIYQAVFRLPVHDPSCPYVLMKKQVAQRLAPELGAMEQGFWWEFIARVYRRGFTIKEIPIHHRTRSAGVTQVYKWKKMPAIFFRHVAAIRQVWSETRTGSVPEPDRSATKAKATSAR